MKTLARNLLKLVIIILAWSGIIFAHDPVAVAVDKTAVPAKRVRGKVDVPPLTEMSVKGAVVMLREYQLKLGNKTYQETTNYKPNTVIQQIPAAGSKVPVNSSVNIVVAKAPRPKLDFSITPSSKTVTPGQKITYKVIIRSEITNRKIKWKGAKQTGSGTSFTVDTTSLKGGNYVISLNVQAKGYKDATGSAELIVKQAEPPPQPNVKLGISPDIDVPDVGKPPTVTLPATAAPPITTTLPATAVPPTKNPPSLNSRPLVVTITPDNFTSSEEEIITFRANTNRRNATLTWRMAGYTDNGRVFRVNTKTLANKQTYPVTLTVLSKGETVVSQALLHVDRKEQPAASSTPQPPKTSVEGTTFQRPASKPEKGSEKLVVSAESQVSSQNKPEPAGFKMLGQASERQNIPPAVTAKSEPEVSPPPVQPAALVTVSTVSSDVSIPETDHSEWLNWLLAILAALGGGFLLMRVLQTHLFASAQIPNVTVHYKKSFGNQQTVYTNLFERERDLSLRILPDNVGNQQTILTEEITND